MNNQNESSRINLDGYKSKPFQLFEDLNVRNDSKFDKLTGTFLGTPLSDLYFSQENLDYLQTQIISRDLIHDADCITSWRVVAPACGYPITTVGGYGEQ